MVCTVLIYLETPLAWQKFAQHGLAVFLGYFCSVVPYAVKGFANLLQLWTTDIAAETTQCFDALGQASTSCICPLHNACITISFDHCRFQGIKH